MIWKVPRLWQGETAYVIGGGYSIKNLDLSLIYNERCIGVNNSYMLGNWIDICWFGDSRWLEWHRTYDQFKKRWERFIGIKVTCVANCKNHKEIKYIAVSEKSRGIETDCDKISWNKTSGGSAINVAYHLGVTKIVLVGFDMKIIAGKKNWHNDHPKRECETNPYPRYVKVFSDISRDLKSLGVDIINTSLDSAIPEELIPKQPLEDVVKNR